MKKLDRFILSSFFGPFILTFLIVIFILMMQFLWLYIDELVGKGLTLGVIAEFLGWGSATLIPMALPLATLLASIMTLGSMGEYNELLAMKSAGISLTRILTPLIFVSVFISIGAFFVSNNLIPVAYQKIYSLREDIGKTKEEIKIPLGTFYDGIDGYILRVNSRNEKTRIMHDLMIYDHTGNTGNTNITLADSGSIHLSADKGNLVFTLYSGRNYSETNKMAFRDTSLKQDIIHFDKQTLIISLENYAFTRSEEGRFGNEIMAKNLKMLKHDNDSLSNEYSQFHPMEFRRFIYGIGLDHMSQIDTVNQKTPLGIFPLDALTAKRDIAKELEATRKALESIQDPINAVDTYERNSYRYVSPLRRGEIESFRKFTLSLACLIFFFIGAPLGAIIRKGGLGTPVIISILFFVIYWVVDISGKKLARDGAITPFIGTFVSTAVLLPIGIFLTWKSTRDSSLFNFDAYKIVFKKIGIFFKRIFKDRVHRCRIVFMGTPDFAAGTLNALIDAGFDVRAVVTIPDKQSGRGLKYNESAVKKCAAGHKIPVLQPVSLKDQEFCQILSSYHADIFVVVAFRMLPKEVWSIPKYGTFNLHASLLPQYRGAAPINWAIINGEKTTGVTTFFIDENIDTGKIIDFEECGINRNDDAGTLHDKLMEIGSALVVKTAEEIIRKRIKPVEQKIDGELKPAPKITRETCRIDWNCDARVVNNLIRGLGPYPAAYTTIVKDTTETSVKIFSAQVVSDEVQLPAGTIKSDGKSYLSVSCGSYALHILDLQVAGKKRLSIKEFLAGFRNPEESRFV